MAQEGYQITLDLTAVKHDRVKVVMECPPVKHETAHYIMPNVVPGTYSHGPYGKRIKKIRAYDKEGNKLRVKRKGNNDWYIQEAIRLHKLEYWVGDTYDKATFIFRPAGVDITENQSYMLNHHCLYGYLEGHKNVPYELNVLKPENLVGSSALHRKSIEPGKEVFTTKNYFELADRPLQYHTGDTASHRVGNTRVHIAVYSENGKKKAEEINKIFQPLSEGVQEFLGEMPVKEYYYLFYFTSKKNFIAQSNQGALEHHHCSVYYLHDDGKTNFWKYGLRDIAAHEFMHILTPLTLHSEYVSDFDFHAARMSEHLWLYEGCTEYFSMLGQSKSELITEEMMMYGVQSKIKSAMRFESYSLTEMSRTVCDSKGLISKLKKLALYSDIYQKGALNAMMIDIRLRELSKGETGLLDVIQQLGAKYGQDKPFDDKGFITEFVQASGYPELQQYFDDHVIGSKPLPLDAYLEKIGWKVTFLPKQKTVRVMEDPNASEEAKQLRTALLK